MLESSGKGGAMHRPIRWVLILSIAALGAACERDPDDVTVASDAIDLVVNGDYVVTMDAQMTIIEQGAVAIDNGVILAVGAAAAINREAPAVGMKTGSGMRSWPST